MEEMENTGAVATAIHPLGLGFERTLSDMRFMGWVSMIYGILTCLSIVGVVVGIPLIIASHRFIEGVNRLELFRSSGAQDELTAGFYELGRSFRVLKIVTIIFLVLMVAQFTLFFILGGIGILTGLAES